MKIFAISIPRSAERHAYIKAHLAKKTRRIFEVIGSDGAMLAQSGYWPHTDELTIGQIGCTLSHLDAYKCIHDQGLDSALIVENDVVLPDNIDDILDEIEKHIRPNEVISLYNRTIKVEKYTRNGAVPVLDMELIYPLEARIMRTTAAYVIGAQAARGILSINLPVKLIADNWNAFNKAGVVSKFRLLHPIPVSLVPFNSTLASHRDSHAMKLLKRVLSYIPFSGYILSLRRRYVLWKREHNIQIVDAISPFQ